MKILKNRKNSGFFCFPFFPKTRKGNILTENIIFIVLNLVFLSILILFLYSKMGSAAVLEEGYAKKIALLLDSAKPGMVISLDMEDGVEIAKKEKWPLEQVITIQDNIVSVSLREKGGYSYSFFNDVGVNVNFDSTTGKGYYLVISEK